MVTDLELRQAPLLVRESEGTAPSLAELSIAWVMGGLATVAACLLGAVLVLVFAATLAVVLVLAAAVMAVGALAWRLRRRLPRAQPIIEGRKVGHSWIAYGWDQRL